MQLTQLAKYMWGRVVEWRRGIERGATIAVVGPQGSGKTTYAYYSIKQSYIIYKCRETARDTGVAVDYCAKKTVEESCWGARCEEPDPVDQELRPHIFVSVDDIPRLIDVLTTRGDVAPFVFVDDLGVTRMSYFDRDFRKLYMKFLRLEEWRRAVAINLVLTTVYESRLAREIKDTALLVYASYIKDLRAEGGNVASKVYRYIATKRAKALTERGVWTVVRHIWVDVVPASPEWAMPPWLKRLIDERKRALLARR